MFRPKAPRRATRKLWSKADLAIELVQQKRNLKPSVRNSGKDAATSAMPTKKAVKETQEGRERAFLQDLQHCKKTATRVA